MPQKLYLESLRGHFACCDENKKMKLQSNQAEIPFPCTNIVQLPIHEMIIPRINSSRQWWRQHFIMITNGLEQTLDKSIDQAFHKMYMDLSSPGKHVLGFVTSICQKHRKHLSQQGDGERHCKMPQCCCEQVHQRDGKSAVVPSLVWT